MVTAPAHTHQVTRLLDGASPSEITRTPYTHLVQSHVLSADIYAELEAAFPSLADIVDGQPYGNNQAVRMTARQVMTENRVSSRWQDFFAYHTSQDYWRQIVRVFGPFFRREFPFLEERAGRSLEDWRVVPRGTAGDADIRLDCQFVMNTPVTHYSSVKAPHVDLCDKIFSSLYYFRTEEDLTAGGDLELFAWRRTPRFVKHRALNSDIDLARTVTYAPNALVSFVNSANAVHGVSPRQVTTYPRRYINLVAELPATAFQVKQMSYWRKLLLPKNIRSSTHNDRY
jgi:hypothetical protein